MRLVLRAQKTINWDPLLRPEGGTIAVVRQRRKIIKQEAASPSVLLQASTPFPYWQSLMEAVSFQRRKVFRDSAPQSPSKVQKDNSLIICSQEEAEIVILYLTPFFLIHFWDERGFGICNLHLYSFLFILNHYLFCQ